MKSVHIRSFAGPYFPALRSISPYLVRMRETTDQKNSEYRNFLCSGSNQKQSFRRVLQKYVLENSLKLNSALQSYFWYIARPGLVTLLKIQNHCNFSAIFSKFCRTGALQNTWEVHILGGSSGRTNISLFKFSRALKNNWRRYNIIPMIKCKYQPIWISQKII